LGCGNKLATWDLLKAAMKKAIYQVILSLAGIFLASLFCYLWQFDYKVAAPHGFKAREPAVQSGAATGRRNSFAAVRAFLALQPTSGEDAPIYANFILKNDDHEKVRLVDTTSLEYLYGIRLQYNDKQNGWQPVPGARPQQPTEGKRFDAARDAILELLPGSAFHKCINLSDLFSLKTEGKYRLTVSYQPNALDMDVSGLDVLMFPISCSLDFDLPGDRR
jgi:hypothetical protein